jgi:hypothetical protein
MHGKRPAPVCSHILQVQDHYQELSAEVNWGLTSLVKKTISGSDPFKNRMAKKGIFLYKV